MIPFGSRTKRTQSGSVREGSCPEIFRVTISGMWPQYEPLESEWLNRDAKVVFKMGDPKSLKLLLISSRNTNLGYLNFEISRPRATQIIICHPCSPWENPSPGVPKRSTRSPTQQEARGRSVAVRLSLNVVRKPSENPKRCGKPVVSPNIYHCWVHCKL